MASISSYNDSNNYIHNSALLGGFNNTFSSNSASTVTGYTGPTGAASTVTGYTGPTGPASTVTGPTGTSSITAGANIGIDNTIPTAPVVRLLAPLTSSLDVGTQDIITSVANANIDLITNGTGSIQITETVAGTNGALLITQSSVGGTTNPILNLVNNNANVNAPTVDFYKNSATPDNNDMMGVMNFYGKNLLGTKKLMADITVGLPSAITNNETAYLQINKRQGGSYGSALGLLPTGIECYNQNVNAVGILTAQAVVCPNMTSTVNPYPKYDANTFVVKDDVSVSTIPNPVYNGELYTGVNGGRTPLSYFNTLANSLGFNAQCVVEFQSQFFWAGDGKILRTDNNGAISQTYAVNGTVYTLCVGDGGANLYVGGSFTNIDGTTCNNIARIDNTFTLSPYIDINGDNGLNSEVYSIRDETAGLGGLFVCGAFTQTGSGSTTLYRIAQAGGIGGSWNTYAQIDDGIVYDCVRFNNGGSEILLVGGSFSQYGGGSSCSVIVGYNISSSTYLPVGSSGGFSDFNGKVFCFTKKEASSEVYIAGDFTSINGLPYIYSVYFPWSNLQNPQTYDFAGSNLRCIIYEPTNGIMYRGGGMSFGINNTLYNTNPPFTIGLSIETRQGILPVLSQTLTFIPSNTGNAYVYQVSSVVLWTTATQIIPQGGSPCFNIVANSTGQGFTLKAYTASAPPRWFVQANEGAVFQP
jgi:hypothetical protein